MNKFQAKKAGLERRKRRVRGKVTGTADRPRLAVHRTNAHIYAQVIDDARQARVDGCGGAAGLSYQDVLLAHRRSLRSC